MISEQNVIEIFGTELSHIIDGEKRKFAIKCLQHVPDYFYFVPASSSGKYHPNYALGVGGLVRHTEAAVRIFCMLHEAGITDYFRIRDSIDNHAISHDDFGDYGIIALLLHDSFKQGKPEARDSNSPHTVHEHPIIAADYVMESSYNKAEGAYIANAIRSHSGKWTCSQYSSTILPAPDYGSWLAMVVHICDYLASRKALEFNFNAEF